MLKGLCHKNTSVLSQFCAEVWKIIIIIIIISNGYRTEWSPIRSVINEWLTKSDDRVAGVRFI